MTPGGNCYMQTTQYLHVSQCTNMRISVALYILGDAMSKYRKVYYVHVQHASTGPVHACLFVCLLTSMTSRPWLR